jgi:hypothetical protein
MARQPSISQPQVVWTADLLVSARPEGDAGAVASCPRMRYDADRRRGCIVFSGSKNARQQLVPPTQSLCGTAATVSTAAAAADSLDRVAGMIKKAVYRSSGRRVRGEDDKITAMKTVAPDLPLDVLRNMDIRVESVVCTPL